MVSRNSHNDLQTVELSLISTPHESLGASLCCGMILLIILSALIFLMGRTKKKVTKRKAVSLTPEERKAQIDLLAEETSRQADRLKACTLEEATITSQSSLQNCLLNTSLRTRNFLLQLEQRQKKREEKQRKLYEKTSLSTKSS